LGVVAPMEHLHVVHQCSPTEKTDNLAARSIRAFFEGKVRLPLTEVRKGLRSSSIRWRGSPESGVGALSIDCEWRSSMAWVVGSSRSAMVLADVFWRFLMVRKKVEKEKNRLDMDPVLVFKLRLLYALVCIQPLSVW
jgi:hypothetical protein